MYNREKNHQIAACLVAVIVAASLSVSSAESSSSKNKKEDKPNPRLIMGSWANFSMYEKNNNLRLLASIDPAAADEFDVYDFINDVVKNKNENFRVRLAAVEAAADMLLKAKEGRFKSLIKPYMAILSDTGENRQIRMRLCLMMGKLLNKSDPQHQEYINTLNGIATNKKEHELVRAKAIESLGYIARQADFAAILDALGENNQFIRASAFKSLKFFLRGGTIEEISPSTLGDIVREIKNDKADSSSRALLLEAMAAYLRGQLNKSKHPNKLRDMLRVVDDWLTNAQDVEMLESAVSAAGILGQKESIDPLIQALASIPGPEGAGIRSKICDSLGSMFEFLAQSRDKKSANKIVEALIRRYLDIAENTEVRKRAVFALGNMHQACFDKTIAYKWLVDYWNPRPAKPRDDKFYDKGIEMQITDTLKMFTGGYNFGRNYQAWVDWGNANKRYLSSHR